MPIHSHAYFELKKELEEKKIQLIAVSKTKPVEDIQQLYKLGQLDFGENYVQELVEKAGKLPPDIRWHFIGHLQTNKIKLILPFVQLIQGVDSLKLLKEINKQAIAIGRKVDCLLQVHIGEEETKFGFDERELNDAFKFSGELSHVKVIGLMGMASLTENQEQVRGEFRKLKELFDNQTSLKAHGSRLTALSMGMTSDYKIAIEEGSTMVRIGSLLFGERN